MLHQCWHDLTDELEVYKFKKIHPKQLINDCIPIPIWKVHYSYNTARGNSKEADKYLIAGIGDWDIIEEEFYNYIQKENEKHLKWKWSNVKILETSYIGKFYIDFEE